MRRTSVFAVFLAAAAGAVPALLVASAGQFADQPFSAFPDHPAIEYSTRATDDPVARLNRRLGEGRARLDTRSPRDLLRSLLDALDVPVESQIVVFSKSSMQARLIAPSNPRTLFFNDSVVVGWVRGGVIEIAAHDPVQGIVFYVLDPGPGTPVRRQDRCLTCHVAVDSLDVPGLLLRSVAAAPDGTLLPHIANFTSDQRNPFEERWAGWYVTGRPSAIRHLGNAPIANRDTRDPVPQALTLPALDDRFATAEYLSRYSDIAALMVFEHQVRMVNLITRIGWEARVWSARPRPDGAATLAGLANELVDYLLFVDEAPLAAPVRGTSGFAEKFAARGPRDRSGRSLRDLDLTTRLMRYRCSYMIYSEAFDALPPDASDAVYRRLWRILSGAERGERYAGLGAAERRAIVEILRETKPGLPGYFRDKRIPPR